MADCVEAMVNNDTSELGFKCGLRQIIGYTRYSRLKLKVYNKILDDAFEENNIVRRFDLRGEQALLTGTHK